MARVSYGDDVKDRTRKVLEKLLAYANDEVDNCERFKIDLNWQTANQVIIRTQLRVLAELTGLTKDNVREALKRLEDFLSIVEDLREHQRGSENWHFKLTLWYDKNNKQENLRQFDREWQSRREKLPGVQRSEKKAKAAPTYYENIPLSGVVEFVGRGEELQKLQQLLQQNQQVAIAAIAGMGGVGKTELALQYAIQHRDTYQGGICWLLPKSGDVGVQIVQFARTQLDLNPPTDVDLPAQVQYCFRNWPEGEVLLVLDDVADYREVKPYLISLSSRFKILMTTRQQLGRIATLSLDVLQPEVALELLKSIIGKQRVEQENQHHPQVALQLCAWLGYLPLGLELVGRYLARKPDLSLAEMLQRLEKKRLEQPALNKAEADMTAQRGVLAAFELSWQELEDAHCRGGVTPPLLGCLLSLFAAAPIPWNLVEQCLPEEDGEDLEEIRDDKLLNLHLLQRKGEGIYQLHPLLRKFFQYQLKDLEPAEKFKLSVCKVMVAEAKKIPLSPTLEQINDVTPAIPHIAEVANNLIQYVSDDDLIWPFFGNVKFYNGQGLYDQAVTWCQNCLEVTKKRLGESHPDVGTSLNNLASLYDSQGRYSEAEPLYVQALELRRRSLGESHPNVATSLNNLAGLYDSQGRYSEAEPLYVQALELTRRSLGESHPSVATSLNNLASLYKSQGRYSEAEPLYVQALELRRRSLGESHPSVATSLNNLALLYDSQGRYSEAEPLYVQALELTRRSLGESHPSVATSLNNLALLYDSQGRYSEAEPLYVQALELLRRSLGESHPSVATSLNNLALLYDSQGRYSEAEPLYVQALELRRRSLGESHPKVASSLNNLASLYDSQGRYSEAEPLYLEALEIFERRLGENHPNTVTVRENLAYFRAQFPPQQ
ncbi:NB-ARC domain-containing protein [Calothrix sp. NIES-2100]|uniref:FxSxx-COOH system tetratricopeptide repeat protein n=1 Tax=Calothrix sp. NIES-2100 TaxID=1954172 RepID=UPI000B60C736|nr:NB-ARC domain-containing protein [Calothrix sp. NIES-2100]